MTNHYQPIIGLEIHVELSTQSKMFCQCSGSWQGYEPNANTCPVCLGLPGALPVPNKQAIERTIKIAQALGCTINKRSHFDRKHYFYPDLPKGYQISQYDEPIGIQGSMEYRIQSAEKKEYVTKSARIHRVHLEEDTGKLMHVGSDSLVDFNRSGVPLVEIVTEADFRSSEEVKAFLQELHTIIRYLDVSDADMEKGSMRLEPNISVKAVHSTEDKVQSAEYRIQDNMNDKKHYPNVTPESLGRLDPKDLPKFKVEVKNINSFNFVKKAVDYEVKRQSELLEKGETPAQETRGWDEKKNITVSQRTKEDAHDYRYFPEPDIPPMEFSDELLETIRATIPELPGDKVERYVNELGIKLSSAIQIAREKYISEYFESLLQSYCNESHFSPTTIEPRKLGNGIRMRTWGQNIANMIINGKITLEDELSDAIRIIDDYFAIKIVDANILLEVVKKVIATNEKSVADYKAGKTNALKFLVGQVMKEMRGQADANAVKEALLSALNSQ
ncbi:MAG TPA: Asp-tRNA(Asn)/Glu-tRNA(Gln) amidotransferase subunit GatB [Candidatus Woesebacteria bacterium]|nr:Asp-tRNA(Asn)/Glu-tRNA(Gln) amidotransferase subunit GatB [Candidatus Woesebacteria bacterium]HNS94538.1 Asp-tRNA(Asn)/Glu-tRNA(Gln) amidotransferase subunit GatB [Candidatus Woesebacteria bacterium]